MVSLNVSGVMNLDMPLVGNFGFSASRTNQGHNGTMHFLERLRSVIFDAMYVLISVVVSKYLVKVWVVWSDITPLMLGY